MRHLSRPQAESALRRGRQVDQLLGLELLPDNRWSVKWLTISPARSGFRLTQHHVEDVASTLGTFDLYELPPIDPEEDHGEGIEIGVESGPVEAIDLAVHHGADPERWVNFGVLADEYSDHLDESALERQIRERTTTTNQTPTPEQPNPLLRERMPRLTSEIERCLIAAGEDSLAGSVHALRIHSACGCSDTTCGSFYTGPRPDGPFGPGHRNVVLDPDHGMMILDVVDSVIRYVELIDRPDVHEALHAGSELSARPLLLLDIDGVLSPFGGDLPPGFRRDTVGSYEIVWSEQHRDWLAQLSGDFQLVWATTWEHSAN